MRKPVIIALSLVLILTLIVIGISYLVQPILPPEVYNILYLFFLILVSVISVIAGFPDIIDRVSGKSGAELDEEQMLRNRHNMLQLVWNTWIEGVLKKSFYNEMLIELGIETRPDAVKYPWDMVIPDLGPEILPTGTKMLDIFNHTNGSLLILGGPGSGKTTMLLELALQAIEKAERELTTPIPVIFNLSSWTPKRKIEEWLVEELRGRYYIPQKLAKRWIKNDEIMLLLDGLDEVPLEYRKACVIGINEYINKHSVMIAVCCRWQEYQELKTQFKLRKAVHIQPLTPQQVEHYLQFASPKLVETYKHLERETGNQEYLHTPLILSVLILSYRNTVIENYEAIEKSGNFPHYLFGVYVQQMYLRRGIKYRYSQDQMKYWLLWLASIMKVLGNSFFYIEELNPAYLDSRRQFRSHELLKILFYTIYGMFFGFVFLLPLGFVRGYSYGPISGLRYIFFASGAGLIFGLLIGILDAIIDYSRISILIRKTNSSKSPHDHISIDERRKPNWLKETSSNLLKWITRNTGMDSLYTSILRGFFYIPRNKMKWSWVDAKYGLVSGLIYGLFILFMNYIFTKSIFTTEYLLLFAVFSVIPFIVFHGISLGSTISINMPGQSIRNSFVNSLVFGILIGMLICAYSGTLLWLISRSSWGVDSEPISLLDMVLSIGMLVGMLGGISSGTVLYGGSAFINHLSLRWLLYRAGNIPFNLINFLESAVECIYLRRVGGGYIFIHQMLMEYFAQINPDEFNLSSARDYMRIARNINDKNQWFEYIKKAAEFDLKNIDILNKLCWEGCLLGHIKDALEAGEQAVLLEPKDGYLRDARGLARALNGNYLGAIEDFKYFVKWSYKKSLFIKRYRILREKRKVWISELEAGRNPFDEETLNRLWDE